MNRSPSKLNQPLCAILTNAQAGKRLLSSPSPDLEEVQEILTDIIRQDRHAGEVIIRVRAMLQKRHPHKLPQDLKQVISDVLRRLFPGDAGTQFRSFPLHQSEWPGTWPCYLPIYRQRAWWQDLGGEQRSGGRDRPLHPGRAQK